MQVPGQFNGVEIGKRESQDIRGYHADARGSEIPAHTLTGAPTWRVNTPTVVMSEHGTPEFEIDMKSVTKEEMMAAHASAAHITNPSDRTYATLKYLHDAREKAAAASAAAQVAAYPAAPAMPAAPAPFPAPQPHAQVTRALPTPSQFFGAQAGIPSPAAPRPLRTVTFTIDNFGHMPGQYTDVIRTGHLLVLVWETAKPSFAPTTQLPMVVYPEGDSHIYGVEVPGIQFEHGGLTFCVLFITQAQPYTP